MKIEIEEGESVKISTNVGEITIIPTNDNHGFVIRLENPFHLYVPERLEQIINEEVMFHLWDEVRIFHDENAVPHPIRKLR